MRIINVMKQGRDPIVTTRFIPGKVKKKEREKGMEGGAKPTWLQNFKHLYVMI